MMLTWLSDPGGILEFGQRIKKPFVEYRAVVSRLPMRGALVTEHV
jgi:hypothetical protein